jgi:formylglycine-generating enzyme
LATPRVEQPVEAQRTAAWEGRNGLPRAASARRQLADDGRTMGGSWWYGAAQMRAEVDAWKAADFAALYIGFRRVDPH